MRRAALQVLRTARRTPIQYRAGRLVETRPFSASAIQYARRVRGGILPGLSIPPAQGQLQYPIQSALQLRSLALFILSSLIASGAWFAYNENPEQQSPAVTTTSILSTLSTALTSVSIPSTSISYTDPPAAIESSKKHLVVQNDQFFTGDFGDQPVSKEVDGSDRLVVEMLTPAQATQKLRQNQESYLVGRGQGVVRYDVVQLASNNPIEDDHVEKIITHTESAPSDWSFWGVFDGHSGWITSAKLRQTLVSYVARELKTAHSDASVASATQLPTPEAINAAIKKGFMLLDHEICHESVQKALKTKSKPSAVELLAPAMSGACALLSFYDSKTGLLRVACTGDSRAVLGRRTSNGKWSATPLSEDQTGGTPSEDARLRAEHPNEPYVTHRGRILGQLEPSRAFGDAIYKWSRETADQVKKSFFGRTPSDLLKTPPYVTAEPVITTTKIDPSKGDFLVMATDGLWECLTNEEVVGLVGQWVDQQKSNSSSSWTSWFSSNSSNLPVEGHKSSPGKKVDGQRSPIRQEQWSVEGGDTRFVVEDKNAATHLIRNALGGKNNDMVCALLSLPSPYSRRYRDDLTVQVIFFGQSDATGDVSENFEASAPIKSKL